MTSPAHCTTTSGAGCVAAGVHRYLGTATAGGFATRNAGDSFVDSSGVDRSAVLGTTPLVTVSNYADVVYAESGVSPGAASTSRSGTLSYWNGTGFTSLTLTGSTAGTYAVPQVDRHLRHDEDRGLGLDRGDRSQCARLRVAPRA